MATSRAGPRWSMRGWPISCWEGPGRGSELLGPDGLLPQVTKAALERALAKEMTGHLGHEKHDPAGRGSGNSRNGPICPICAVTGPPELDLSAAQIGG